MCFFFSDSVSFSSWSTCRKLCVFCNFRFIHRFVEHSKVRSDKFPLNFYDCHVYENVQTQRCSSVLLMQLIDNRWNYGLKQQGVMNFCDNTWITVPLFPIYIKKNQASEGVANQKYGNKNVKFLCPLLQSSELIRAQQIRYRVPRLFISMSYH